MVGLLDLVVVAGCVGLIYGGRESEIGETREIFFFFLGDMKREISCLCYLMR